MAYLPADRAATGTEFEVDVPRPPRARADRAVAVLQARTIVGARARQETGMYPADLKYTKDHEWVQISGAEARVGITDYAQKQLGDVVYLELPDVGRRFSKGDVFGTIESVKAVSELYAPVGGEVTDVNRTLIEKPETVNKDPHGAWMIVLKTAGGDEDLLDAAQYTELTK
jgi:glycine cleavage system H protein